MKRTAVGAGLLVALVAVAALAIGGVGATTQADETTESNGSFGAEVSSFMQASSAEAESEVDDGMFNAAMKQADTPEERRAAIERRQERLQQRQERLQDRRSRISAEDGAGVRDRALAAHVTVGATNLERSANGTEQAARSAEMDTGTLDEIRSNARNLRGPEVTEMARNLTGTPVAGDRGPPSDDERGPPTAAPVGGESGSEAQATNRSNTRGPSDDTGANGTQGNGSQGEGTRGNGSDRGSDGQRGDQADDGSPSNDEDDRGNAQGAQADSED